MRKMRLTGIVCTAIMTVFFEIAAQAAFETSVETDLKVFCAKTNEDVPSMRVMG